MSHWDNIKIPKYGKSDSMVRFENGNQEEPIEMPIIVKHTKTPFDWAAYSKSVDERANKIRSSHSITSK